MAPARIVNEIRHFDWQQLKDLETVGSWPAVVRVALLLAYLLCLGLGGIFVAGGWQDEIDAVVAQSLALQQELAHRSPSAADLSRQKMAVAASAEALSRSAGRILENRGMPELLDGITAVGSEQRMTFSHFDLVAEQGRGSEQDASFYIEQSVRLQMLGSFHDFAGFISGITALPGLVTLADFAMERQQSGMLKIGLTLHLYRHGNDWAGEAAQPAASANSAEMRVYPAASYGAASLRSPFDEIRTGASGERELLSPGRAPDRDRPLQPLEKYALSALTMVGMIARGPVLQALILDDSGVVHRVGVGQNLGQDYGKVREISSTQLMLTESVEVGGEWLQRPRLLQLRERACALACAAVGE